MRHPPAAGPPLEPAGVLSRSYGFRTAPANELSEKVGENAHSPMFPFPNSTAPAPFNLATFIHHEPRSKDITKPTVTSVLDNDMLVRAHTQETAPFKPAVSTLEQLVRCKTPASWRAFQLCQGCAHLLGILGREVVQQRHSTRSSSHPHSVKVVLDNKGHTEQRRQRLVPLACLHR